MLVLGRSGDDLLSRVLRHSTIGAEAFNGRVRDGIGFLAPRSNHRTGQGQTLWASGAGGRVRALGFSRHEARRPFGLADLMVRGARAHPEVGKQTGLSSSALQRTWIIRAIKPIERLVPVSSTRYRAYTSGLSTWSSSTALKGDLVLRGVSRLDAFSGYPVRT